MQKDITCLAGKNEISLQIDLFSFLQWNMDIMSSYEYNLTLCTEISSIFQIYTLSRYMKPDGDKHLITILSILAVSI